HVLRLAFTGERAALRPDAPELLEEPAALAQVNQLRTGGGSSSFIAKNRPDHREPVRIRIRQGLKQYRVHYAEDRRIGPDPNRQRRNGNGGKARFLRENAECKAQVLPHRVEKRQPALLPVRLPHLLDAAESAARGLACLVQGHPSAHVFLRKKLEVRTKLGVQVRVQAPLTKERKKPQ